MKKLIDIVNEAKDNGVNLFLATNGAMNSSNIIDSVGNFITNNKVDHIFMFDEKTVKEVKDVDEWLDNIGGPHAASLDHVWKKAMEGPSVIFC